MHCDKPRAAIANRPRRHRTGQIWLLILCLLVMLGVPTNQSWAQAAEPADANQPDIMGGREATPGAWPWQAALVRANVTNAYTGQFCGGSLIAGDWVLTAAHCVDDVRADEIAVVLGRHALSSTTGERIAVQEIIIHPAYKGWWAGADLALLHLVQLSTQTPITVDAENSTLAETRAARATVTGWGAMEGNFSGSDTLREVAIPLVARDICNAPEAHAGRVTAEMLCAGYAKGGTGACYGDSGGPIMISQSENAGWLQVGIVSWGPAGCNRQDGYSIFTRVASFQPWIQACLLDANSTICSGGDEYETDNTAAQATLIAADGARQLHTFHRADDVDWLQFNAKRGSAYLIETLDLGAASDTILWLFASGGVSAITYSDDNSDNDRASRIIWTAPADDLFLLQVENYRKMIGAEARYAVRVFELNQHLYLPVAYQ